MLVRAERHMLWAGVLALLILPALVRADVRDSTGLFSQNAVHQANATIEQIHKQTGKDVIVEVFGQIPSDLKANYKPDQQAAFFNNWMRTRAQQLNVNGIYILICRDPNYLDVGVGAETRKRAFTMEDRNRLSSMMLDSFKRKQFDQGLIEGVNFIQRTMQTNLSRSAHNPAVVPPRSATGSSRGGGLWWGWWVLIAIGVIYLIARLLSASRRRNYYAGGPGAPGGPGYGAPGPGGYPGGGYPTGGYYPPGGGGGFGRGLLGGLLGGAAGGWLYDKFRGQSPTYGGSNMPQGPLPPDQASPPDQGQGFEGTGGGFGDSSSDQGGGFADNSGGGDFGGGGDSGGGGDFGGGGGGDDSGGGTF